MKKLNAVIIAFVFLSIAFFAENSFAVTRTWDGGGATNNWSEAANWSGDSLPQSFDDAVFDATGTKNCVIDTAPNSNVNLFMNSGYTGTVSMASGVNATFFSGTIAAGTFTASDGTVNFISNAINLTGGTFNAGSGTANLRVFLQSGGTFNGSTGDVTSDFFALVQITGGVFNAPIGNLNLSNNLTVTGGNFNHNNGTIRFIGGFNQSVSTLTVNNVVMDKVEGTGVTGNLTILGTLTLTEGLIDGGGGGIFKAQNAVNIAATFGTVSGNGGNGQLLIQDGAGPRTITISAGGVLPAVRLNDANATINTSGTGTIQMFGFIVDAGTADFGAADLTVTPQAFTQNGGAVSFSSGSLSPTSYTLNGGTMTFDTGNITFGLFGILFLNNGVFNMGSGTLTIPNGSGGFQMSGGTFNGESSLFDNLGTHRIFGGTFNASSGTTNLGRGFRLDNGATFNANGGTVNFVNTGNGTMTMDLPAAGITFNDLRTDVALIIGGGNPTINGEFRQISGTINSNTLRIAGNMFLENTAGGGNSNILFTGTGNQTYTNNGPNNFTSVWTVDKSGGTVNLASDLDLSGGAGNFVLTDGTITTNSFTVNLGNRTVSRTNGHVIGNLRRAFTASGSKTFDVGTANGYSPVAVNATTVIGSSALTVSATHGNRTGMNPAQSVQRFWTLTETGDITADLTFNYLQTDVVGDESGYQLYKWNGMTGTVVPSTLDTTLNTVSVTGISEFSDWAIGNLAPTAASVAVGGRVLTDAGRGIYGAKLTLTDSNGNSRTVLTNPFGYYKFDQVRVGESYVVSVVHKAYEFANPNRVIFVIDTLSDVNFTALNQAATGGKPSIGGRVANGQGEGLKDVVVELANAGFKEPLIAKTDEEGFYKFENLKIGETYFLSVRSEINYFADPVRVITLLESIMDANFVWEER